MRRFFRAKAIEPTIVTQETQAFDFVAKHGLAHGSPPDMIAPESKVVIELMKTRRRGGAFSGGAGAS